MLSIACPFCDENTRVIPGNRIVSASKIYYLRECTQGHRMFSVEYIPKDQDKIENQIRNVRENQHKRRLAKIRSSRRAKKIAIRDRDRSLDEDEE